MAKIIHTNFLDVVDNIFGTARKKNIMHLNSEEKEFKGTTFIFNQKNYISFGTCGYLGLEQNPNIIEGGVQMMKRYGTQFSVSRAFVRPPYIQELEELVSQIFDGNKVITYSSTSLVHQSVIGSVIKPDDLVVLDQQVHYSVQYPCQFAKLQGTEVKMVRHSNYDMLETILKEDANKYNRIWYMSDGVYSMYGDLPDLERLKDLMIKYPKLHLYFDDAHGVGWAGKNGSGTVFSQLGVSERIILISTLAKGFGCAGGIAILGDKELYRKIDTYGGVLSYTHPLTPANVGAAIESAKIHLSNDIYTYQNELKELMIHLNTRISEKNLPNASSLDTPIYFIGAGSYKVTHNLIRRILNEGIYVNTATFPVVPNDKSGLRFTLTRHNTKEDINTLTDALSFHLPKAIEEENDDITRIYSLFNVPYLNKNIKIEKNQATDLSIEECNSINEIDKDLWNNALANRGNCCHSGMQCIEEIFSNNEEKENNWSFHYPVIKDAKGKLICTTFFTSTWAKDDMLALENVSKKIEKIRETDPYFLCSKTLTMSSMFSEGDFLYLDREHPQWKEAIKMLFAYVERIKKKTESTTVIFRDFEEDHFFNTILEEEGYAKLTMPNANVICNPKWESTDEFLSILKSKNNILNIKRYVFRNLDQFHVEIKNEISDSEAEHYYKLFLNIKRKNFAFNFFEYPRKITKILSKYKEWEFINIKIKGTDETVCAIWCYKGMEHYSPLIMGLNYDYLKSHHLYKQAIFQTVKRGNDLNMKSVFLGFSADTEKAKYGAQPIKKKLYLKVDDTYNLEFIESFSNL